MILRAPPARLVRGAAVFAVLLLAAPGSRGDAIVAGTMPEDYMPGLMVIVRTALTHGPSMISQQISVATGEANLLGADSQLYPQLSAGGTVGASNESVGESGQAGTVGSKSTGTVKSTTYNVNLYQPIWQWGAIWNQTRISKLQLLISQKSYADAYRTFLLQLRDSYLSLVRQKFSLNNARLNLTLAQTALANQQAMVKAGIASTGSVIGPELLEADTHLAFDRAQQDYFHAKRLLALMAGMPDIPEDSIPTDIPKVAYSPETADMVLAECLRDGAKSTFQAQSYEMNIRQQELTRRINMVAQLPKISGSASYGLSNSTSISLTPTPAGGVPVPAAIAQEAVTSTTYGLNASWDIFDGWRSLAAIRTAKLQKRYYERSLQTYLDTTLEAAQDDRRQLDYAARAMALAERRRDLANAAFQQATNDYKLGVATQASVDNSRYNLQVSLYSQAATRSDFLSRWSQFLSLTGADPALGLLPAQYVRVHH